MSRSALISGTRSATRSGSWSGMSGEVIAEGVRSPAWGEEGLVPDPLFQPAHSASDELSSKGCPAGFSQLFVHGSLSLQLIMFALSRVISFFSPGPCLQFLILVCCSQCWLSLISHSLSCVEQNLKGPEDVLLTLGLSICIHLPTRQRSRAWLSAFCFDSLCLSLFYFIHTSSVSSFRTS